MVLVSKLFKSAFKFFLDCNDCTFNFSVGRSKVRSRENRSVPHLSQNFSGHTVYFRNSFDFISKEFNANRVFALACRKNIQNISSNSECTANKINIISYILNCNKFFDYLVSVLSHARSQRNHKADVILRVPQTVNT